MTNSDRQVQRELILRMISLTKAYRRYANEELERSGLSHSVALVVTLLNDTRVECSQKFLADHLDVAPASLVPLLKQIESSGLITRRHDPEDKRVNHIELTAKGEALAKEARRVLDNVRHRVCAGIDPDEVATALRVVTSLQGALAAPKPHHK